MMKGMSEPTEHTGSFPAIIPGEEEKARLPHSNPPEVLIIAGMSGAGRTRVADTLEDLDWYVIDNLPAVLLSSLTGLITSDATATRLALVVNVRSKDFSELIHTLDSLRESGTLAYRVLFLECADEVLVKRYEQVRRPHPLQGDGRLLEGIHAERRLLKSLKDRADTIIDTSTYSVHDLARKVRALLADEAQSDIRVTVMSFGFKYGLPVDADNVVDVRFLPNPYWVTELRHLTGHDEAVAGYVLSQPGARKFVESYAELVAGILEGYKRELKPFVTIAVGCTGGKHRSVAIAEALSENLRARGQAVRTHHRDLGRE